MWTPRYWPTGYWTGRYWPPGAVAVPVVHPHAVVTVGTSRTFHMEWAAAPSPASALTAPPPVVDAAAGPPRLRSSGHARSQAIPSRVSVRSRGTLRVAHEGGATISQRGSGTTVRDERATTTEVDDD